MSYFFSFPGRLLLINIRNDPRKLASYCPLILWQFCKMSINTTPFASQTNYDNKILCRLKQHGIAIAEKDCFNIMDYVFCFWLKMMNPKLTLYYETSKESDWIWLKQCQIFAWTVPHRAIFRTYQKTWKPRSRNLRNAKFIVRNIFNSRDMRITLSLLVIVNRLSPITMWKTWSVFSSLVAVRRRPDRVSSSRISLPFLYSVVLLCTIYKCRTS